MQYTKYISIVVVKLIVILVFFSTKIFHNTLIEKII